MQRKIILDLCGGSGNWSQPYREAGYDVRLVTLPDSDILSFIPPDCVYGVLAAPPCTMFSLARTRASKPADIDGALVIVNRCLSIIQQTRPKFWALENPVGHLSKYIGRAPWKFENWQFGEKYSKPTMIWGYYNVPKVLVTKRPPGTRTYKEWQFDREERRSLTSPLFARAFFESNQ